MSHLSLADAQAAEARAARTVDATPYTVMLQGEGFPCLTTEVHLLDKGDDEFHVVGLRYLSGATVIADDVVVEMLTDADQANLFARLEMDRMRRERREWNMARFDAVMAQLATQAGVR